jgi:signal transduction histidine kinase/GAF domain-containing protein
MAIHIESAKEATGLSAATKLLGVGTTALEGFADGFTSEEAAKLLTEHLLDGINRTELPVRCLILLATADWCKAHKTLCRDIRACLAQPGCDPPPLIGGSMARIYCSTNNAPVISHGAVLIALCSKDIHLAVTSLEAPYGDSPKIRRERVREVAKVLLETKKQWLGLGTSAHRDLVAFMPGVTRNGEGRPAYLDNELYQDILDAFDHRMLLFGASAAADAPPWTGYQFANDQCLESGLALALFENDLCIGAAMTHGFSPISDELLSVDEFEDGASEGYWVTKLDGIDAAKRLQQLKERAEGPLHRPIFGLPFPPDHHIVVPLEWPPQEGMPVGFARKLSLVDRLCLLGATPKQLFDASQQAVESAIAKAEVDRSDVAFILGFACTGRFRKYEAPDEGWGEAVARFRRDFPRVPIVGALCAGEFAEDEHHRTRANNMSAWVTCLANRHQSRARNRILQRKISEVVPELASCDSPRGVMDAALRGASEAGALGGQICLVETIKKDQWRILGKRYGRSFSPVGAVEDWTLVLRETDRAAPHPNAPRTLPPALTEWAIDVLPGPPSSFCSEQAIVPDVDPAEDILTCVVRTRHAVFVRDSQDPKFLCDADLSRRANVKAQLVLPLIGRDGFALATMQLGLPEGVELDYESFGVWIAFSQQVAASLERAQEAEERKILAEMMQLGNSLRQKEVGEEELALAEIESYLTKLIETTGADYAHCRIDRSISQAGHFELVATSGDLTELHRKVRPVLQLGQGSCQMDLFTSDCKVANTRKDVEELCRDMKEVFAGRGVNRAEWEKACSRVCSAAKFSLKDRGVVIGVLSVDSFHEYFFTQRLVRILRACANQVAAIVAKKKSDYMARQKKNQLDRLVSAKTSVTHHLINGSADEHWRPVIETARHSFNVETAVLYYGDKNPGEKQCVATIASEQWLPDLSAVLGLISDNGCLLIVTPKDPQLALLAAPDRIKDVFAIPLFSADDEIRGALVFLNRKRPAEAPYGFENDLERIGAWDVAREIASALRIRAGERSRDELKQRMADLLQGDSDNLMELLVLHDFVTPLTAIQRSVDTLRAFSTMSETQEQECRNIELHTQRAVSFVRDSVTRSIENQAESLHNLINEALASVQRDHGPLPQDTHITNDIHTLVRVKPRVMVGVFAGLLSNALDEVSRSGRLTVLTEQTSDGGDVVVRIHNTGRTFTADEIGAFRSPLKTTKQGPSHLGLGLPLAEKAIRQAGGKFEMHSPPGGGIEVKIVLPIARTQ